MWIGPELCDCDAQVETDKLNDTHNELEIYHAKHNELQERFEAQQHDLETRLQELRQKGEAELRDARATLMLEHEVRGRGVALLSVRVCVLDSTVLHCNLVLPSVQFFGAE